MRTMSENRCCTSYLVRPVCKRGRRAIRLSVRRSTERVSRDLSSASSKALPATRMTLPVAPGADLHRRRGSTSCE
jgi:hypothetical protein